MIDGGKTMYDELVKRLRETSCGAEDTLWWQAADAIEELICEVADEHNARLDAEERQRWIPVTERLPEEAGYYITVFSKGEVGQNLYMTFADRSGKWYQNSEDTGKVTHWMPLPTPPKAEEGE